MEEQIQSEVTNFIGKYGWMFFAGASIFLFKSTIESAVEGFKVLLGDDLNTDDVVIFDGRPARVIRVGIWKTTFFLYTIKMNGKPHIDSGNKMSIQNDQLKIHDIEKPLKKLDLSQWEDND